MMVKVSTRQAATATTGVDTGRECVVLLHGLARTAKSMQPLSKVLQAEGYSTVVPNYASRKYDIEVLAETTISKALADCREQGASIIHFVSHSLGGILVRWYLLHHRPIELGRVVMLGPPNHGSEVGEKLSWVPGVRRFHGPVWDQLTTAPDSVPNSLGAADYAPGIIAGTRTINPILSLLIPGKDDGKVSVKSAKLAGMGDFVTVPVSHTYLMKRKRVYRQVIHFLKNGRFLHKGG